MDWLTILGTVTGMLAVGIPAAAAYGRSMGKIEQLSKELDQLRDQLNGQGKRFGNADAEKEARLCVVEHQIGITRPRRRPTRAPLATIDDSSEEHSE